MADNSWEQFAKTFNKLSKDPKNIDLWLAVDSWCCELSLQEKLKLQSHQITQNIKEWIGQPWIIKTAHIFYKKFIAEQDKKRVNFLQTFVNSNNTRELSEQEFTAISQLLVRQEKTMVVLIAFILTGIGVLLSFLESSYILVLVLNAENNQTLINNLKNNKKITSAIWEDIYTSTEALWMGDQAKFEQTKLNTHFASPETNQPSEYDVYFVQMKLSEYETGFSESAGSLERSDAFEELTNIEHEVISISPRLSIKNTENSYLYR
ncbi:hypothetical protein PN462_11735 [Spirulina sp. CS-785/01]|uniref:hypothetical protein n=1 Tax=Spirulina sp. CS-785/01 TaxID=3021716 RepID=UPI002330CB23|nr:hypothetical protein [Spirulina sp. CS-785/01]MDB9313773.1 hypothetical protein [Spirulina sp. CS-785/01]